MPVSTTRPSAARCSTAELATLTEGIPCSNATVRGQRPSATGAAVSYHLRCNSCKRQPMVPPAPSSSTGMAGRLRAQIYEDIDQRHEARMVDQRGVRRRIAHRHRTPVPRRRKLRRFIVASIFADQSPVSAKGTAAQRFLVSCDRPASWDASAAPQFAACGSGIGSDYDSRNRIGVAHGWRKFAAAPGVRDNRPERNDI